MVFIRPHYFHFAQAGGTRRARIFTGGVEYPTTSDRSGRHGRSILYPLSPPPFDRKRRFTRSAVWRRRAGSNRCIAVLQTAPLATWVRRLVRHYNGRSRVNSRQSRKRTKDDFIVCSAGWEFLGLRTEKSCSDRASSTRRSG